MNLPYLRIYLLLEAVVNKLNDTEIIDEIHNIMDLVYEQLDSVELNELNRRE